MEGDVIITQDLFVYDIVGEDANGNIIGRHRSTGIGRPRFWDRARYYGEEQRLAAALDAADDRERSGQELTGMPPCRSIALFFLVTRRDRRRRLGIRLSDICRASGRRRSARRSVARTGARLVAPLRSASATRNRAASRSKARSRRSKQRRAKAKSLPLVGADRAGGP